MLHPIVLTCAALFLAAPTALGSPDEAPEGDCIYVSTLPEPNVEIQCLPPVPGHVPLSPTDAKDGTSTSSAKPQVV